MIDTRQGPGQIAAGSLACFTVAGLNGIPLGATGVLANLSATGYVDWGWISAYPTGEPVPVTSTLSFDPSQYMVASSAVLALGGWTAVFQHRHDCLNADRS